MDFWFIIKQRYMFFSFFIIIILFSLIMLMTIWKNRSNTPKILTAITTASCVILIITSIFALIFLYSFGYNS